MTAPRLQRFAANTAGRDLIVGDIHGCFKKLAAQLDAIGFDASRDRLFSVGDLVDRGPDCDDVLEWLARPWFLPVRGNHDDMAMRWPAGNMDAANYMENGGAWNIGNPRSLQLEISAAMAALPIAIELQTAAGVVCIVHADVFGDSWPDFAGVLETACTTPKEKELQAAIIDIAQWSRDRVIYQDPTPVEGCRAVVVGHNPVDAVLVLGNTHHIDTKGWRDGHDFTLLNAAALLPEKKASAK